VSEVHSLTHSPDSASHVTALISTADTLPVECVSLTWVSACEHACVSYGVDARVGAHACGLWWVHV
jgi:hypothetical protein